jgi:4-hydroxybenzoate polyprenyltransferase
VPSAALLRLIRWPGALTAASNAAAGFLVTHATVGRENSAALIAVAAAGALVYAGGVALNDVADADRDGTLHPRRPIPSGAVTRKEALGFGVTLVIAGVAVSLLFGGPSAGMATALAALFALLYDFRAKDGRLLGALSLGAARAANAVAGTVAGAAVLIAPPEERATLALVYPAAVFAYTALLTWASTFEGARPSKLVAATFAVALFTAAALPWPFFTAAWRAAPALAYVPLLLTLVVAARRAADEDGPGMGALIRAGVFAFLLVDAAWLFGGGWYDAAFALLLVYVGVRVALARARS